MRPDFDILDFGEPEKENSIIKVIGVGGGGGNAVNHMYREGIHDVSLDKSAGSSHTYDLNGRRVEQPKRGIYIIDGRKTAIQ